MTSSAPGDPPPSYLGEGEEWPAPPPTTASPPPQPAAPTPAPAAPPRGRGHVRGVARSVEQRQSGESRVLAFRVDQYDAAGNRMAPVGVELHNHLGGQISEGEEVEVEGTWKSGTLHADKLVNRTTGAEVKGIPSWVGRVALGTFLVFFVFVLCVVVVGFITTL